MGQIDDQIIFPLFRCLGLLGPEAQLVLHLGELVRHELQFRAHDNGLVGLLGQLVHPGDDLVEVAGKDHHGQPQQKQEEQQDNDAQNVLQIFLNIVPVDGFALLPVHLAHMADDPDDAVGKLAPEGNPDAQHQHDGPHQQGGDLKKQLVQQPLILPGIDSFTVQFDTPLPRRS